MQFGKQSYCCVKCDELYSYYNHHNNKEFLCKFCRYLNKVIKKLLTKENYKAMRKRVELSKERRLPDYYVKKIIVKNLKQHYKDLHITVADITDAHVQSFRKRRLLNRQLNNLQHESRS